jgi:hypothetical protein
MNGLSFGNFVITFIYYLEIKETLRTRQRKKQKHLSKI